MTHISIPVTVLNTQTNSDGKEVGSAASRGEYGFVAVEAPGTLTTNTGKLEVSDDGVTYKALQDIYGADLTFSLKAGKITMLPPINGCLVKRYVRLVLSSAVSADRNFIIYVREVS